MPNLKEELQNIATHESALYIRERMQNVQSVGEILQVHDVAVQHASIEGGLALEFGVFSGNTINHIASRRPEWTVDGFDSFEGLPEAWRDGFDKGCFDTQGQMPQVLGNVRLFQGWFDQSLPDYLARVAAPEQKVCYLHVDCDLYSSTKTILDCLADRIVPGSVIVFDEYFNYDGWQVHEFKAFQEFVRDRGIHYDYITYNFNHQQAAVKIR